MEYLFKQYINCSYSLIFLSAPVRIIIAFSFFLYLVLIPLKVFFWRSHIYYQILFLIFRMHISFVYEIAD